MQRYAIVDTASKKLLTVVEYDTAPTAPPPGFSEGVIAIQHDTASGDWTWDGSQLVAPPAPVVAVQPVTSVSPRQARLALLAAGLLDKVEATVAQVGGATKIAWEYATEINRNDPLIATLGQQLQLTDVQIDALFVYASKQ